MKEIEVTTLLYQVEVNGIMYRIMIWSKNRVTCGDYTFGSVAEAKAFCKFRHYNK